jgi:hypothetical protein
MSDEWIACAERMPPSDQAGSVLMWNGHSVMAGWFSEEEGRWLTDNEAEMPGVTHWRPMPEGPHFELGRIWPGVHLEDV